MKERGIQSYFPVIVKVMLPFMACPSPDKVLHVARYFPEVKAGSATEKVFALCPWSVSNGMTSWPLSNFNIANLVGCPKFSSIVFGAAERKALLAGEVLSSIAWAWTCPEFIRQKVAMTIKMRCINFYSIHLVCDVFYGQSFVSSRLLSRETSEPS